MKTETKNIFKDQSLDEIRHELSEAEMSGISDEEYIALLSKHTSNLVGFVEQLSNHTWHFENFEDVLGTLFQDMAEPICVLDSKHSIVYFNSVWKKCQQKTKVGIPIDEILPEDNQVNFQNCLKNAEKSGKRSIFTLHQCDTNQLISILPFTGFDEQIKYLLLGYSNDVLKNLSSVKSKSKKPYVEDEFPELNDTVLNMLDGFYLVFDADYQIKFASINILDKLGYTQSKVLGKSISKLFDPETFDELSKTLNEVLLDNPISLMNYEIVFLDRDKVSKPYEITIQKPKGKEYYIALCSDLGRFKLREKKLIEAKRNAELNDKNKSNFLANMSHEIRTPLNGIIGFSSMLNRSNLVEEKREKYLRIIRSSTMHLLTLVSDIIDISKIEAGQLEIVYNKFNLHQVLEELQATYVSEATRLRKKNIRIIKQTANPKKEFFIKNDEIRLRQILSNILGNALKFTDSGDIIFGYRLEKDNRICFFIKDDGVGLSPSVQRSIFNRYKQTAEGKKEKYNGTGLGLAITKGLVKLMGGKIEVKSELGMGSEFFFTIPFESEI